MDDDFIENDVVAPEAPQAVTIEWTPEHEGILIEWADKAMCYRWLHSKSYNLYARLNAWYTIPVIIISTITGTANFAQERVPVEYQNYFAMVVGTFSIAAGIITTIQQFLKITQLNEAHRVSSIAWDKFYRNIKIEISKHPDERINVTHMIKMCKEEFDRLMETSPTINEKIIAQFNYTFPNNKSSVDGDGDDKTKMTKKTDIKRPEICNELISTADIVFVPIETDDNERKMVELVRKKNRIKANCEKEVNEWVSKFKEIHERNPLESEILDNLQDKMHPDVLNKIVKKVITGFETQIGEQSALNNV